MRLGFFERHARLGLTAIAIVAGLYGFAFGLFGQGRIPIFIAPLALLGLVVFWTLPHVERPPVTALEQLFWAFLAALIFWPDYIAVALPGMPWITLIRLTSFPLCIVLLLCLRSPGFVEELISIFRGSRVISWLVLTFTILAGLSIGLSRDIPFSVNRYLIAVTTWSAMFVTACYIFSKPNVAHRLAYLLWAGVVYVCAIGLYEARFSRLPWAGHIPAFFAIQDEAVQIILAGTSRAATGVYRVQGKFSTSLGLGEYLGLSLPFILHLIMTTSRQWVRFAAMLTLPLMLYIVIRTDSRLALIGFFVAILTYIFVYALRLWLYRRDGLLGPAITLIYPAVFGGFVALSVFWRRLSVMIWGGGAQAPSTEARKIQYQMGMRILERNPIGHGIGEAAVTLGYIQPGSGLLTIDSYYLSMALELGVIGFLIYYGIFLFAVVLAGRMALVTKSPETLWLAPAAISLIYFLISKSVFSQQDNHPLVFVLLGFVVALLWQEKKV